MVRLTNVQGALLDSIIRQTKTELRMPPDFTLCAREICPFCQTLKLKI